MNILFKSFKELPFRFRIGLLLAGISKLVCLIAIYYFAVEFSARFFTEIERMLLFVIFTCWYINKWVMDSFKQWKEGKYG